MCGFCRYVIVFVIFLTSTVIQIMKISEIIDIFVHISGILIIARTFMRARRRTCFSSFFSQKLRKYVILVTQRLRPLLFFLRGTRSRKTIFFTKKAQKDIGKKWGVSNLYGGFSCCRFCPKTSTLYGGFSCFTIANFIVWSASQSLRNY